MTHGGHRTLDCSTGRSSGTRLARSGLHVVCLLVVTALLGLPGWNAQAAAVDDADKVATTITLTGPDRRADTDLPLAIALVDETGQPVADAPLVVERRTAGDWAPIAQPVTDAEGHAALTVVQGRVARDNAFRTRFAGDATYARSGSGTVRIGLIRRNSRLTMRLPSEVQDEDHVRMRFSWRTGDDQPIAGTIRIFRRSGGKWRLHKKIESGEDGTAVWRFRPRNDGRWRATGVGQDWVRFDRTRGQHIDNTPPGRPVRLPKAAPRPRIHLPAQPRAKQPGPAVSVTRIPNRVWRQMTGISWHRGCPIGRDGLRLIRVNYWAYDGYRRRGEMVVNARAVGPVTGALKEMYRRKLPIRSMYRVDRFGWSKKLGGGNDYKSMAAGNSSAFNCRSVVNKPGVRSPHSYGGAVDLNTWENPYRSRTGIVPNTWWQYHSHPRVAWRSGSHPVVQLMRRNGLRWTYGNGDTQHFDATLGGHGRVVLSPPCVGECH